MKEESVKLRKRKETGSRGNYYCQIIHKKREGREGMNKDRCMRTIRCTILMILQHNKAASSAALSAVDAMCQHMQWLRMEQWLQVALRASQQDAASVSAKETVHFAITSSVAVFAQDELDVFKPSKYPILDQTSRTLAMTRHWFRINSLIQLFQFHK